MRILVIEDDNKIASFIITGLKQAGYAVDHAADGGEGFDLALTESYGVIILDIMLPGMDGLVLLEELRKQKINSPVLILSAKRSVQDRIRGLQAGSDDYLIKPFAFSELLARVQALLRRRSDEPFGPTQLSIADLSMNLLNREVQRAGQKIDLPPREFSLLEFLMRNKEKVVSKTTIMEHVWNYNFDPQTNVVDVLVCRVRNKVDRDFDCKLIHTIRGVGYVLKAV